MWCLDDVSRSLQGIKGGTGCLVPVVPTRTGAFFSPDPDIHISPLYAPNTRTRIAMDKPKTSNIYPGFCRKKVFLVWVDCFLGYSPSALRRLEYIEGGL